MAGEYSRIYVYNLRGNQRTAGELSRKEGGKIFGSGSRNTVAVLIGIKNPAHTGDCEIFYRDIGDYLSREQKLEIVDADTLPSIDWQPITPNAHGDWVNHRNDDYLAWPAIGEKSPAPGQATVFTIYSSGLKTGRDSWCYNSSRTGLVKSIEELATQYRDTQKKFAQYCTDVGEPKPTPDTVATFLAANPELTGTGKISWNRGLRTDLAKGTDIVFADDSVRLGSYRPFNTQWSYLDRRVNDMIYKLPTMFPTSHQTNIGIVLTGAASHFEFTPFITDLLPNLHVLDTAQFFPRWTYAKAESADGELDFASTDTTDVDEYGYRRIDNITDSILALYRGAVGDQVTKDDIFFYVYGLVHDPAYRQAYAADLKKMLPRIPTPETQERFEQLTAAGRQLADLHVNYETVAPYDLDVQLKKGTDPADRETWRVAKLKWGKKKDSDTGKNIDDRTTIVYNPKVTITGIPEDAERYMLGSRSALAWIIDRYQIKPDKASGIVNDPNNWCDEHGDPTYIVDLIKRVTTVAVETMRIVDMLAETKI